MLAAPTVRTAGIADMRAVPRSLDRVRRRSRLAVCRRCGTRPRLRRRARGFCQRFLRRHRNGDQRGRGERQSAAGAGDRSLAGRAPAVQSRRQESLHPAAVWRAPRRCERPAGGGTRASRPQAGAAQQSAAPRDRCGDRRTDAALRRSRANGSTPRRRCSSRAMRAALKTLDAAIAKETDPTDQARTRSKRAPPSSLYSPNASTADKLDAVSIIRDRGDQDARGLLAGLPDSDAAKRSSAPRPTRSTSIDSRLADVERGAERLVRPVARLGAAARRDRARHHVRRHGRHQHGAWRDGDARRLHDVRGAGSDPRTQSGAVRLFAGDGGAARVSGRRVLRRSDRAHHHPVSLWPAARDPARDLGPVIDHSAGGAHDLRPVQPRRRRAILDERRVRARRHHHHLQPAVDHLLHARRVRGAARRCCGSRALASKCAP